MNKAAFDKISYGLYIVSSKDASGKDCGCIINTFTQVTSSPAQAAIAVNKENYTAGAILDSGVFDVTVLTQSAPMELIGLFGFQSSRDVYKFDGLDYDMDVNDVIYPTSHCAAHFACHVVDVRDAGSHYLFTAEIDDSDVMSDEEVMTYAYYHDVKKGMTPPKASSYREEETQAPPPKGMKRFRCDICGYIIEAEDLPDDFVCPVCQMGREHFHEIT